MKIIIIGGGPAGLISALRLKQVLNAQTVIYEIRSQPTTLGGAVQLPPNGLRLLEQLGLYDILAKQGFLSSRLQVHSMRSELLADLDRSAASYSKNEYGFMRILRHDLLQTFLDVAAKQEILVHYSKDLTAVEESEEGVTVRFADGSIDDGDIVLGCDGIHSAVRSLHVDPSAQPTYSGVCNMFGLVGRSELAIQGKEIAPALHATMTAKGLLAVSAYTANADRLYWFYSRSLPAPSTSSREGWEALNKHEVEGFKQTTFDLLHDATGAWNDQLRDVIQSTDSVKFYPIYKIPPKSRWHTKRCLLLGDAAHAMQPHIGQGTSMAIEDAFFLARLLADPKRPLSDVFSIFESIRRPRVEKIAQASADRGNARDSSGPLWHRLREIGIGIGFWIYKVAQLDRLGIGMDQDAVVYDITTVPIPEI